VYLTPESRPQGSDQEQYRLYRLVWSRFTACQMANATYDNVVMDVDSNGCTFRANYSELKFPGYTAIYEEARDEDAEDARKPLPSMTEGQTVYLEKMQPEQQFTQPPARYTEATLIRAMEENGIGRPSTYAPTISTITAKEYVVKDGKYLKPTPLGEVVTKLMEDRFSDIVDLKFTANMEQTWTRSRPASASGGCAGRLLQGLRPELTEAETAMEGERSRCRTRSPTRSATCAAPTWSSRPAASAAFWPARTIPPAPSPSLWSSRCPASAPSAAAAY
jgi:DNA topoisomerase-1